MAQSSQPQPVGVLTVDGRKTLTLSGVKRMGAVSPTLLVCDTSLGMLTVKGHDLHVQAYSQEEGVLRAEGRIDSAVWSGAKQPLLKRLFR